MGICGNVQQQNCDVLVDIRSRDTPDVSKMTRCLRSSFAACCLDSIWINVYEREELAS